MYDVLVYTIQYANFVRCVFQGRVRQGGGCIRFLICCSQQYLDHTINRSWPYSILTYLEALNDLEEIMIEIMTMYYNIQGRVIFVQKIGRQDPCSEKVRQAKRLKSQLLSAQSFQSHPTPLPHSFQPPSAFVTVSLSRCRPSDDL